MKVLVTGGAGFIGSHLVTALIECGHSVAVVDNLATGRSENVNSEARFYQLDICSPQLRKVFEAERPELVNHHAAQTAIQRSVNEPLFDAEQNILGSLNLILQCLSFGVKKIIYASSGGAVYGEPKYRPVDETHSINPVSQYGVSKFAAELYLELYGLIAGLDYTILRYANVYGPGQSPKGEAGVVAIFSSQMLRGECPTVFGHGDKTRDYVHVSDVVAANLLAIEKGRNGIYNIGTGVETSDKEVFDAVADLLGYRGDPLYAPARTGEIYRICLDATKAWKELGWKARYSFKEGLASTVGYYEALFGKK